ncbi:MAG: NADH-quinone oxidoreductase subunit E [Syntrophorhabdaceae bacterium PtaU1.Bin034]|nr:MAG: NADH-quinone oxidoreductase subunit E [Syntrophorhabdaceae bacterium PtaU1.Bin034]
MYRAAVVKRFEPHLHNILYILHELQDKNPQHYVAKEDIEVCADYLNVPYSYVHGVATFYTMFSLAPRGQHIIRLCDSPPCHLMGSTSILDYLKKKLNIEVGQTTDDGTFTLETCSCLGVCGVAPAIMINDEMFGKLTPERVDEILEERRKAI